jgi:hypothetical protein
MIFPSPLIAIATAVLLTATSFGWGYIVGNGHGKDKVQASWDKQRAAMAEDAARQQTEARKREQELQARADQIRQEKAREVTALTRRHAAIVDSLRNRPEARAAVTDVPPAASDGVGCTGQGLARPDAQFLAGFAADAARLQAAFDQCRAGYQAAKERLDANGGEMTDGTP